MHLSSLPILVKSSALRPLRKVRARQLFIVHIGKCGGSSLRHAVTRSRAVKNLFTGVRRFHFEEPEYSERADYLIAVRNPILRSQSAFYYRRHLLNRGGQEKNEGEREVFSEYSSFNELSENLFEGTKPNRKALDSWNLIHHLGDESIQFYLGNLLPQLSRSQVFGVISVEHFAEDLSRTLGVTAPRKRIGPEKTMSDTFLTPKAIENLERLLEDEFSCLRCLLEIQKTPAHRRREILRSHVVRAQEWKESRNA